MESLTYNNPRIEKYYPIENDKDFFKFAVMEGNEIAKDSENKEFIFQDIEQAIEIVNARKAVNLKRKLSEIQAKADKEKELLQIQFDLDTKLTSGVLIKIFDTFLKVDATTKEQIKDFLTQFPATPDPIKDEHITQYDFNYKIGISNSAQGKSIAEIRYKNSQFESVWMQLPIELLDNFVTGGIRGASNSEHVYFMGVHSSQLRDLRIHCKNFKAPQVKYYGGNTALKDAQTAKEIINYLLS